MELEPTSEIYFIRAYYFAALCRHLKTPELIEWVSTLAVYELALAFKCLAYEMKAKEDAKP